MAHFEGLFGSSQSPEAKYVRGQELVARGANPIWWIWKDTLSEKIIRDQVRTLSLLFLSYKLTLGTKWQTIKICTNPHWNSVPWVLTYA